MDKFFNGTYWLFRIVIPGQWCALLGTALVKMYDIKIASEILGGLKVAGVSVSAGLVIGLLTHYLFDYPRRRKRFKEIEEAHGPIHYILKICTDCSRSCRIEKSYAGVSPFYFSILNDEIPSGTRSMTYYFSSVYLMFTHIAFYLPSWQQVIA